MTFESACKKSVAGAAYRFYYKSRPMGDSTQKLILGDFNANRFTLVHPDTLNHVRDLTEYEILNKTNGYWDWVPVGEEPGANYNFLRKNAKL